MKHFYFLTAFLSMAIIAHSQQKIEVEVGQKNMSKGQQTAITVLIPEAKSTDVEPLWKKYVNNRGFGERIGNLTTQIGNIFRSEENQAQRDKFKVEKNGDEMYIRSIEEDAITKHSLDIYARMTELPEGCQFSVFFQYTDSVFLNESSVDPERIENMKSYIRDFGVEAYKKVVDDQIKEAEKEVSRQEGVLKDIESDSKKEGKTIARYETDIQECNSGITLAENDIARLDESITANKRTFATLNKKNPEYDAAKSELKQLDKEKSKSFNKIKSLKSKIKSKEMDIKSANEKIAQNDTKTKEQQVVIQEKQKIVDQLIEKKKAIQ